MYFINYIKALYETKGQVLEPPSEEIPVIDQNETISRSAFDGSRYLYKLPPDLDEQMKEGSIRARLGYKTFEETPKVFAKADKAVAPTAPAFTPDPPVLFL